MDRKMPMVTLGTCADYDQIVDAQTAAALYDRMLGEFIAVLPAGEQAVVAQRIAEKKVTSETYWQSMTPLAIWHEADDDVSIAVVEIANAEHWKRVRERRL